MAHNRPAFLVYGYNLILSMAVNQLDAEYIVECMRILLQDETIPERAQLAFNSGGISDGAIGVFGRFLRETTCHLQGLTVWELPSQQIRRLLVALHTNRSVKELSICELQDDECGSWIADLSRHKQDFTEILLSKSRFPLTQILPLLSKGQPQLKELGFDECCCWTIQSSLGCLLTTYCCHQPQQ